MNNKKQNQKQKQDINEMNLDEFIAYLEGEPNGFKWLNRNKYNIILIGLFSLLIFLMLTK